MSSGDKSYSRDNFHLIILDHHSYRLIQGRSKRGNPKVSRPDGYESYDYVEKMYIR